MNSERNCSILSAALQQFLWVVGVKYWKCKPSKLAVCPHSWTIFCHFPLKKVLTENKVLRFSIWIMGSRGQSHGMTMSQAIGFVFAQ